MANRYLSTSVGRKFLMALSAFFLLIFLILHLSVNILSVFSAEKFNQASEFMGTNPLIQFVMQPILFFGIIFHFVMGFALELRNRSSRDTRYAMNKAGANSSVFSRYMIYSGATILLFLGLHMVDFFFPSFAAHHITHEHFDSYEMVVEKFQNPIYVGIYVLAFAALCAHLLHGFQSAFQSVGLRHPKYVKGLMRTGKAYSVVVTGTFAFIALYHYFAN